MISIEKIKEWKPLGLCQTWDEAFNYRINNENYHVFQYSTGGFCITNRIIKGHGETLEKAYERANFSLDR